MGGRSGRARGAVAHPEFVKKNWVPFGKISPRGPISLPRSNFPTVSNRSRNQITRQATQFFYHYVGVPVLSEGLQCSMICASELCIFILYHEQLHTSIGTKVYTEHLDAGPCPPAPPSYLSLSSTQLVPRSVPSRLHPLPHRSSRLHHPVLPWKELPPSTVGCP
jgi:hypothetical protein